MRRFVLILATAFVFSSLWAGVALADCSSNCDSQLQTCDQGCQYIEDDAKKLSCQNGCLSGYFHCIRRCDNTSSAIVNEEFQTCKCSLENVSYVVNVGETVDVTGTLVRVFAIGGETTGWAIELDQPLRVEGEVLNRVEIDLSDIKFSFKEGEWLRVTGTLLKRYGIERDPYWVIKVYRP